MCAGTEQTILWGEVDKVNDELFWCHDGAKLPGEIAVTGTTDEPFFLASLASSIPNLNAIMLNRTEVYTIGVYCMHSKQVFEKCNAENMIH